MKSHEAARIATGERIIAHTREELRRPDVVQALGAYAERTIAILDNMYAPPVIGGQVIVPQERRDTDSIALILSRSSRRLSFPCETTPRQIERVGMIRTSGWMEAASDELTTAEVTRLNEYGYEEYIKGWGVRYSHSKSERLGSAIAVAHCLSSVFTFQASKDDDWRKYEIFAKPFVTIDPSQVGYHNPTFIDGALIHELQHIDDRLEQPVLVYPAEDEDIQNEDIGLRMELRAYAVQAAYLLTTTSPNGPNVFEVEDVRERYNGPLLESADPFAPTPRIKRSLARQGLDGIYR